MRYIFRLFYIQLLGFFLVGCANPNSEILSDSPSHTYDEDCERLLKFKENAVHLSHVGCIEYADDKKDKPTSRSLEAKQIWFFPNKESRALCSIFSRSQKLYATCEGYPRIALGWIGKNGVVDISPKLEFHIAVSEGTGYRKFSFQDDWEHIVNKSLVSFTPFGRF